MIHTEHSTHVSRNCIDLKRTEAPFEPKIQPVSNFAKSQHAPPKVPNTNVKCPDKAKLIPKRVEVSSKSNSMYTMCSGHISKPAKGLITQM